MEDTLTCWVTVQIFLTSFSTKNITTTSHQCQPHPILLHSAAAGDVVHDPRPRPTSFIETPPCLLSLETSVQLTPLWDWVTWSIHLWLCGSCFYVPQLVEEIASMLGINQHGGEAGLPWRVGVWLVLFQLLLASHQHPSLLPKHCRLISWLALVESVSTCFENKLKIWNKALRTRKWKWFPSMPMSVPAALPPA